ncbi:hypothetical protein SAMN02745220_04051 [Desulfopila aestuarii DSM 18488]|uniref:Uncharacterized protein n=2 Tax=Desulfopila aestuarii TaxID=231440 RepID=A0A1M7YFX0_9BACT|nr:hypothetical protein SAMN02745220_04051 [Desulfopila aestuarii DSM 18488]
MHGRHQSDQFANGASTLSQKIQNLLAHREFSSLEEAQALLDKVVNQKNAAPLEDFHGLSSSQMYRFLHYPFSSLDLVHFNALNGSNLSAPILKLLSLLMEAIGNDGLKATAKGNLPRKFCTEATLAYYSEKGVPINRYSRPLSRNEEDFYDLHCLRLLSGLCGILRKYNGKFIIGTSYRKELDKHGPEVVYQDLLQAYCSQFNWGYGDGYEDIPFVQQSFIFSLYILSKYGDVARPQEFYEDIFLKAFPNVLKEVQDKPYRTAEEQLRNIYSLRTFRRCFRYFGLAEVLPTASPAGRLDHYDVRKTPLLDKVVTFTLS